MRPYSFKPADKRPFPWESPPDPREVAHEVFQAWLTFAIFDNARRGHLGTDLEPYRTDIARMMAPMSTIAAAQPRCVVPRRARRSRTSSRCGPTTAWSATRTRSTWSR